MSASKLTLRLVKSFATRTRLLFSTAGGRSMVLFSFALSDSRAHWFARSSMATKGLSGGRAMGMSKREGADGFGYREKQSFNLRGKGLYSVNREEFHHEGTYVRKSFPA